MSENAATVLAAEDRDYQMDAQPTPKYASEPFNNPRANLILRSADGVHFRVRDGILAEASAFFQDMLSLPNGPRPLTGSEEQEYYDGIPVIPVSESLKTLDNLLRFCYPVENPVMDDPGDICDVLEASRKYIMGYIERLIMDQFDKPVGVQPLQLYGHVVRRTWNEEIKKAALASLLVLPPNADLWVPEMELIGAGPYMRLLRFRQECSNAAANAVLQASDTLNHDFLCPSIVKNDGVWFACYEHRRNAAAQNAAAPTATPTGLLGTHKQLFSGSGHPTAACFNRIYDSEYPHSPVRS